MIKDSREELMKDLSNDFITRLDKNFLVIYQFLNNEDELLYAFKETQS